MVIARDSSVLYHDTSLDVHQVGERLGVEYLLTGEVRILGDQVRINTRLRHAGSGETLWEGDLDGTFSDIFAIQDRIVDQVLERLLHELPAGGNYQQTTSMEAYDSYLYGRQHFFLFASKDVNDKARALFTKAIEFDPEYANSYAMLAWTHVYEAMNGWSENRDQSLQQAYELSSRALQLKTDLPVAYFVRGLVNRERKNYVRGLVDAENALQYDPNYANAHMLLGTLYFFAGEPEKGLSGYGKQSG